MARILTAICIVLMLAVPAWTVYADDGLAAKYEEALQVIAEQDKLLDEAATIIARLQAERDQYRKLYEQAEQRIAELTEQRDSYKSLYEQAEAKCQLYLKLYEDLHKLYLKLAAPKLKLGIEGGYEYNGGLELQGVLALEIPISL